MSINKKVDNSVVVFCREHGIKYRVLAAMIGVSVRTVEGWAQGKPMSKTARILFDMAVEKIKKKAARP